MMFLNKALMILFLAFLTVSCTPDNTAVKDEILIEVLDVPPTKVIETEILELINNYRLSLGLNVLENLDVLKAIACTHTDYMLDNNKISHDNFYTRSNYLRKNACANAVSENVAYGYCNAKSVVNAWLKSDSHRETIEGDFTNFNISAERNTDGRWYYTNIFIKK